MSKTLEVCARSCSSEPENGQVECQLECSEALMSLTTPVDPPPNAVLHAPLIPVKTNGCDVGFLNFENEEEFHSSLEDDDESRFAAELADYLPMKQEVQDLPKSSSFFSKKPLNGSFLKKSEAKTPSFSKVGKKVEKKTVAPAQAPDCKSSSSVHVEYATCIFPLKLIEEMSDWLNENAGKYDAFVKKDKNLAVDLIKSFKDSLPCGKCGSVHAFTMHSLTNFQMKSIRTPGRECSMSIPNLLHSLPAQLIEILVHAVAFRASPHDVKNFLLWACSGRPAGESVNCFYKAAHLELPIMNKALNLIRERKNKQSTTSMIPHVRVKQNEAIENCELDATLEESTIAGTESFVPITTLRPVPEFPDEEMPIQAEIEAALLDEIFGLKKRLQALENELNETKAELNATKAELKAKNTQLKSATSPPMKSYTDAVQTKTHSFPVGQAKKLKLVSLVSSDVTSTAASATSSAASEPRHNLSWQERYQDIDPNSDDIFTPASPKNPQATGDVKLIYFKGVPRRQPSFYRGLFYKLGLPANLIRDISFLNDNLMMLVSYESLEAEIADKLISHSKGRVQQVYDPLAKELYPEFGNVSKETISQKFFLTVRNIATTMEKQLESRPVLTKTVNFLNGVLASNNHQYKKSPPKSKVFLMNRFWNLEELEADAGGPTLMQQ
jgi:hypothetical protein